MTQHQIKGLIYSYSLDQSVPPPQTDMQAR